MNASISQLTALASSTLRAALVNAPNDNNLFHLMTTTRFDGEVKPVLVVGNAHADFNDGHVIAVLNPEQSLANEIKPGVAYGSTILKSKARGRCDALLDLFVSGLNTPNLSCIYRSRKPESARFSVP